MQRIAQRLVGLFLLFYLVWEFYWYRQVGMLAIKWHTHLMALVYAYLLVELIISRFTNRTKIRSYVLPIFIGLFSTETVLSLTDWVKTHSEKNYQPEFD